MRQKGTVWSLIVWFGSLFGSSAGRWLLADLIFVFRLASEEMYVTLHCVKPFANISANAMRCDSQAATERLVQR